MFSNFINSVTDLGNKMKRVTETDRVFIESYLEGSWNNKLSTVINVFYQYHLSTKALISESDDYYDDVFDKLEKKNPIPNFTSPSGLWAMCFADYFYDEKRNIKIFKKFIILNYEAPSDPVKLLEHLFSLYLYYMRFKPTVIPFEFASQIDNVTTELVTEASTAMLLHRRARNNYIRTSKSTKTIRKKGSERDQEILEGLNRIKRRKDLSDHRVSTMIRNNFKTLGKKPPSHTTIKKLF